VWAAEGCSKMIVKEGNRISVSKQFCQDIIWI
jgi:hypothetical protein